MSGATLTIPNTETVTGRIDLQRSASTEYWLGHSGQDKGWKADRPCRVTKFRAVGKVNSISGSPASYVITLYKNSTSTTIAAITRTGTGTFNTDPSLSNADIAVDDQLFVECVLSGGNVGPVSFMIDLEYL